MQNGAFFNFGTKK